MRVAGPHHFASIFEDLNGVDPTKRTQFQVLIGPGIDDAPDVGAAHAGNGKTMIRMETDDAADASLGLRDQEVVRI
jgi:hypothetical protein